MQVLTEKKIPLVKWVTLYWFLFGVHLYQPPLDFAFFRMNNIFKAYTMLHQVVELPNDPGRPLSYYNFIDKKKWLLLSSSACLRFLY